ncbi:hypothetical protein CFN16_17835 [Pseudomonas fluorescens]|uniref:Uncharacterized protein n=1 Tax=Pseudomonas fluorescens TaxID=294 RepID=A0A345UZL2_PSEFL|nr:hypothetical protein [Pseudomonas fluorescens]AXJ05914.1 hypothetical protein CFN16_17835 [Pseudomonas fluorescens]
MSETTFHCNGRLAITVEPREMRMSHWLYAPLVVDQQRQQTLLDLSDSQWDLISSEETTDGIDLLLRKYPGDMPAVTLSVSLADGALRLEGRRVDSSGLEAALDLIPLQASTSG